MSEERLVFVGQIVSSCSPGELSITNGYLVVENGKIIKIGSSEDTDDYSDIEESTKSKMILLDLDQFLMPGFVDCHTHAPQFPNIGLGLDRPLLEWLDKYTFPLESKYSDINFAAKIYDQVVQRLIKNGTTTACYFGTLHLEGTLELVQTIIKRHQRALVGKVSMNIRNDAGYYNETQKELTDVETFVKMVLGFKNDLVSPIVTPRFALSCDKELMTGLSKISTSYGCMVQSHISENREEVQQALKVHPGCSSYGDVYDKSQILNDKCIMAHAVHLNDEEIALLAAKGVSVAHCPASNTRLRSGLCPVRKLLDNNITVGLGTDVSGGDSVSMLDAIRRTMDVSTHLELLEEKRRAIDWKEAFYLATLGGAKALNLGDKIGSFEVGKEFDALVIDANVKGSPLEHYEYSMDQTEEEYTTSLVQRFMHLGDDRNILLVYVKGQIVKDTVL